VRSDGPHHPLPYTGPGAVGLGKPLRPITHPLRSDLPIWLGAEGPRNVALAAEIAEGWQALFLDPRAESRVFGEALAEGRSRRDPGLGPLDVMVPVPFALAEPVPALLDRHRAQLALYIGGMGAKGRNFSNDLVRRYGYAREAALIQELFLGGRRAEAAAAVPDDLVRATALVGPPGEVRDRLAEFAAAGVTTMLAAPLAATRAERVKDVAELRRLLDG
jgi:F420-dependent oxidoreductase-like protein